MKDLLKKLKLIDYLQTELEIEKNDFVNKLRVYVDEGSTSIFSDTFDVFSSSKNQYKGQVDLNGFKIKRRRKFFDMNMNMAVASGTYHQNDNKLIIETEINGFHGMMIPYYIFCLIIYGVFFITFLSSGEFIKNVSALTIPFILFHAVFMLGLPYYMMKSSTKKLKHELEREFFYLTK